MNSEDKFRELLNEKLGGKEFPFQADHWEKAQGMIDAARGKKKRRAAMLWILLLLTLGASTFLLLNLQPETGKVAANTAAAPAIPPAGNAANTANSNSPSAHAAAQAIEQTAANSRQQAAEPALPARNSTPAAAKAGAAAIVAAKTGEKDAGTAPVEQVPARAEISMAAKKSRQQAPKERTASAAGAQAAAPAKEESSPAAETHMPIAGTTAASPEPAQPETTTSKSSTTTEEPASAATEESRAATLPPAITASVAAEAPETTATTASAAATDSAATAVAAPAPITKPAFIKHVFFAEAGVNALAGWPAPEKRDALGINPVFGLGYLNQLSETIGISFGLQYTSVGNLGAYSHTSTESTLGLGAESTVTVITPARLHYLAIPLKLNAHIDANSSFGIGYTLAYLVTAQSTMETYEQRPNFNNEMGQAYITSNHAQSKVTGYTRGFSSFDSQVSAFYRRRIHKELWVNADLLFGLTDIKDNKFFASQRFERNLGLKVTLSYNLFKK